MTRVRKYLALAPAERRLFREAYALVIAMRLASWTVPFARVRELAARIALHNSSTDSESRPSRERVAFMVRAASNAFPGGHNCLVQALAAETMLLRRGYPAELRIGVANPTAQGFKAHAWLESEGLVVIGDFELESYVPLGTRGANPR